MLLRRRKHTLEAKSPEEWALLRRNLEAEGYTVVQLGDCLEPGECGLEAAVNIDPKGDVRLFYVVGENYCKIYAALKPGGSVTYEKRTLRCLPHGREIDRVVVKYSVDKHGTLVYKML